MIGTRRVRHDQTYLSRHQAPGAGVGLQYAPTKRIVGVVEGGSKCRESTNGGFRRVGFC